MCLWLWSVASAVGTRTGAMPRCILAVYTSYKQYLTVRTRERPPVRVPCAICENRLTSANLGLDPATFVRSRRSFALLIESVHLHLLLSHNPHGFSVSTWCPLGSGTPTVRTEPNIALGDDNLAIYYDCDASISRYALQKCTNWCECHLKSECGDHVAWRVGGLPRCLA